MNEHDCGCISGWTADDDGMHSYVYTRTCEQHRPEWERRMEAVRMLDKYKHEREARIRATGVPLVDYAIAKGEVEPL